MIIPDTINMIKTSEDIGKIHVSDSLKICLNDNVTALDDKICLHDHCHCIEGDHTQNNLPLSTSGSERTPAKSTFKISNQQNDV